MSCKNSKLTMLCVVVGNLDDHMNEELLKKAANVMHAALGEFKLKCSMTLGTIRRHSS